MKSEAVGTMKLAFFRLLAHTHTKDRQAPGMLRHSFTTTLIQHLERYSNACGPLLAFAASLLGCHNIEGNTPSSISEIIAEVSNLRHYSGVPAPS